MQDCKERNMRASIRTPAAAVVSFHAGAAAISFAFFRFIL
jgi:hypothetical protein